MTALDDRLRPRIADVINRFGRSVQYTSVAHSYSPGTGQTTPTSTTRTIKVTPPDNYDLYMIDGQVIRKGDCKILIADFGLQFTPEENDKVQIDNLNWLVVSVKKYATGELTGAWELQLRVA